VSSLIFNQSNYPLQTVIKGDTVVILTKEQANEINDIFESQTALISKYKTEIAYKDSLLLVQTNIINSYTFNEEIRQRLDLLEHWMLAAAINNVWIYYSWQDSIVYSVDLSQYYVRKDDHTGDIFFYRSEELLIPENNKEEPPKGWENDFVKQKRPIVKKVPIKI
jgi:hypothetical protein